MSAPSSFFFRLGQKLIPSLLSGTGQELTKPDQIRGRVMEFYYSLYSSKYVENVALMEQFCVELLQEINSQLDQPLQLDELHAALQSIQGRRVSWC